MRSMRTTLLKPYDEDGAVTKANNSVKLSLQASRGGTNQKPLTGQVVSFKSWPSTNLARVNSQCKQEFENKEDKLNIVNQDVELV